MFLLLLCFRLFSFSVVCQKLSGCQKSCKRKSSKSDKNVKTSRDINMNVCVCVCMQYSQQTNFGCSNCWITACYMQYTSIYHVGGYMRKQNANVKLWKIRLQCHSYHPVCHSIKVTFAVRTHFVCVSLLYIRWK